MLQEKTEMDDFELKKQTGEFTKRVLEISAVCYTICTIFLYLCLQTAETKSPEPFS